MDINKEYASKGVAGAGLGTGIAGLSLGVINAMGGLAGLGGLFNNRASACGNDMLSAAVLADCLRGRGSVPCGSDCDPVTQREMRLVQEIAAKDSQIALRDANTYGDQKALEMYKYVDGRFRAIEAQLASRPSRTRPPRTASSCSRSVWSAAARSRPPRWSASAGSGVALMTPSSTTSTRRSIPSRWPT